jgi:hypothetical protein
MGKTHATRGQMPESGVFGAGAGFGEVGIAVLDARVGLTVRELIGEAVVGFAGIRLVRAGSIGRGIFSSAFAGVGVEVGRLRHKPSDA